MSQDKADLGEQALSKVAEMGIASQLDEVEDLNIEVRTDPVKVIQGKVDSVSLEGKGMVMQGDLRVEKMQLETDSIAVNPLKVALGEIELTHPTEARTLVVLTENDINRAFNSEFIREKLQGLQVSVDGQPIMIDTQQVEFRLPGENKISLSTQILRSQTNETQKVAFTAVPQVSSDHQQVQLDQIEYSEGQELSSELTDALLKQAHELLNLRNFELEGMQLYLKELKVDTGKMTLICKTQIEQFSSN